MSDFSRGWTSFFSIYTAKTQNKDLLLFGNKINIVLFLINVQIAFSFKKETAQLF